MTVVDTTVWIDYLNGHETPQTIWLDHKVGQQPIALTDLILCEVLQGLRDDSVFDKIRRDFMRFQIFDTCGTDLAIEAAQNYRQLGSKGITVRKTIDCLIATFCIRNGHPLLHNDPDYDAFEQHLGLSVIHP